MRSFFGKDSSRSALLNQNNSHSTHFLATRWIWLWSIFMVNPGMVEAGEFVISGARAMGMGGAGVAVTTNALATYWNPAGLAMSQHVDIRIQGSVQGIDRLGIRDTINALDNINTSNISAANQTRLQNELTRLQGTSISNLASGGVYLKGYWGKQAVGVSISDVATGGLFVPTALSAAVDGGTNTLVVNGQLQADFFEARQIGLSYALSFAKRLLAIGVTGKVIQGAAYSNGINPLALNDSYVFFKELNGPQISYNFGLDVGAVFRPFSWIRFGIIGKDVNEPTFDAPNGQTFRLTPQIRGGVALNPYPSLTIAFDSDITANRTFVPNIKSRMFSLGAEQTLFSQILSLRIGAVKNVEDAKSFLTPTAGFGLRILGLTLDIAGGYDFKERGGLASGTFGWIF